MKKRTKILISIVTMIPTAIPALPLFVPSARTDDFIALLTMLGVMIGAIQGIVLLTIWS